VGNYSYGGTGSGSSSLTRTLVESWNGAAWSVAPGPSPSVAHLYGVSCTAASSCTAVGDYTSNSGLSRALIESWNGSAWSIVPNPSPAVADLYGVSCISASSCKAVGEYTSNSRGAVPSDPLVESWNGTAWTALTLRIP
jgi:hypothetical protein